MSASQDPTVAPAQVVYAVGGREMSSLSHLAHKGQVDFPRGEARLLEAICPQVWPSMRLRVEEVTDQNGGIDLIEPFCTVTPLRRLCARLTFSPTADFQRQQFSAYPWPQQALLQASSERAMTFYNRMADLWAANREDAEAIWRSEAARKGLEVTIEWPKEENA